MPIVRPGSHCPRCSGPLVQISLSKEGATIDMRSCATCHSRSWFHDDVAVDLAAVLAAMASGPAQHRPEG